MDKRYSESKSEFSFSFGGENYIYADTLSKTIENVIEGMQIIASNQEPEAFLDWWCLLLSLGALKLACRL